MDFLKNPFAPGAGSPPPELAGRDALLEAARVLLGRVRQKRPEKSIIITGLRGVGKTVLLNEIACIARSSGYQTIQVEAHENKTFAALISPALRNLLYELDRMVGVGDKVKRGLAVLRSFIGGIKISSGDFSVGLDIDPLRGTADSGDIEIDLPNLFLAVAEAAEERKTAVALLIDEIQYVTPKELGALIMTMHLMQQRQLPMVLVAAGLPIMLGLAGESKTYSERLFFFPDVGALAEQDVYKALRDPVQAEGANIDESALKEIYLLTQGYPYFVQEWGYQAWNKAENGRITVDDVRTVTPEVGKRLDTNFFRVRFDRLTPAERQFLRTMAEIPHPRRTGAIAKAMGATQKKVGMARASLIRKGMIYSPAHGELAFSVPFFDEFMLRAMPEQVSSAAEMGEREQ
jgi:hypothetical protein